MNSERKTELKRAYKATEPRKGVFAVRSLTSGRTWVDAATNIDTIQNRIWFTLRMGTHPNGELQRTWNQSDPDAMAFDVVEVFDEDVKGYELEALMKERKQHWMQELGAEAYR